jgi:hypothetical protein
MASSFLLGEERQAQLVIHNIGTLPIEDIELYVEQQYVAMSAHSQAAYYMQPEELREIKKNMQAKRPMTTPKMDVSSPTPSSADHVNAPSTLLRRLSAADGPASPAPGRALASMQSPAPASSICPAVPSRRLVTFDPGALKSQLPLRPGGVLTLKVDIIAHTEWSDE